MKVILSLMEASMVRVDSKSKISMSTLEHLKMENLKVKVSLLSTMKAYTPVCLRTTSLMVWVSLSLLMVINLRANLLMDNSMDWVTLPMVKLHRDALNLQLIQVISRTENLMVLAEKILEMVVFMKEASNRICTKARVSLY